MNVKKNVIIAQNLIAMREIEKYMKERNVPLESKNSAFFYFDGVSCTPLFFFFQT